jgi:hypothetical protein
MQIFEDARLRPQLFIWYGPPTAASFQAWRQTAFGSMFPEDLVDFWKATGGADIFETESIFGPLEVPVWGDQLAERNQFLVTKGLPANTVAIHQGCDLTLVDLRTFDYAIVDRDSFREISRFQSFEQWYLALRSEYAERYGLPQLG